MQRHQIDNTLLHQARLEENNMQIEEERIIAKNDGKDCLNDFAECFNVMGDMILNSLQIILCLIILIVLFFAIF